MRKQKLVKQNASFKSNRPLEKQILKYHSLTMQTVYQQGRINSGNICQLKEQTKAEADQRINDFDKNNGLSRNELIGYLLT